MNLAQKQQEFCRNVSKLIEFIYEEGYGCTFGDAYRSKEQAEINQKKGIGIVDSLHCKRLAIDLNLFHSDLYLTEKKAYEPFGAYWKALNMNNKWGGDWKTLVDSGHFEMLDN